MKRVHEGYYKALHSGPQSVELGFGADCSTRIGIRGSLCFPLVGMVSGFLLQADAIRHL